jgi:hypothetical protein
LDQVDTLWHNLGVNLETRIVQLIDSWQREIIDFMCDQIATPSETPPGDERQIANLIIDRLNRLGLQRASIASEVPERRNVLYLLKGKGALENRLGSLVNGRTFTSAAEAFAVSTLKCMELRCTALARV